MRVFNGFLIVLCSTILILLPITAGTYDFRTDLKEDEFRLETGGGITVANVTLLKEVYDDDFSTISVTSDDGDDIPVTVEYHATTRLLDISGLAASTNRTLTVSYDVDALGGGAAIGNVMDKLPWIWLILIFCFPVAAIVAILLLKRS